MTVNRRSSVSVGRWAQVSRNWQATSLSISVSYYLQHRCIEPTWAFKAGHNMQPPAVLSTNPPHLSYASAQLGCACFLKHASASSTSVSSLRLLPGMPSSSIAICQNPTSSHGSFQAVRPLKPFPWKPDCACSSPPRRPMALGLCCSGTWIMPHVAGLSEFVCSSPSL